jgi:hypothetical protein
VKFSLVTVKLGILLRLFNNFKEVREIPLTEAKSGWYPIRMANLEQLLMLVAQKEQVTKADPQHEGMTATNLILACLIH